MARLVRPLSWGRLPAGLLARPVGNRPHARRRARAALLSGAAATLTSILGLTAAVETARPEWRDPEFGHRLRQFRPLDRWPRTAAPDRPLVVILGSSRTGMGLSPAHLGLDGPGGPVVYNFSHTGYGPPGERVALHRLLARGHVPDRVLIEVMPPNLAVPAVPDDHRHTAALSLGESLRLAPYRGGAARETAAWATRRAAVWADLRYSLLSHAGCADWLPRGERMDHLWAGLAPGGWLPYYPAELTPAWRAAARGFAAETYRPHFADFGVAPLQDRALRDLLAAAAAAGATPALLLMPESPWFRGLYPPGGRAAARAYVAALGREHGAAVFDAADWVDDEDAFTDGHHLLGPAAEAFSRRLGRDALGPWLGLSPRGGH